MISALMLAAAVTAPPKTMLDVDRAAIRHVVEQRHQGERVSIVIVHGGYALASGRTPAGPSHDGLRLTAGSWHVVCTFSPVPTSQQLVATCGFPAAIADEISANLSTNAAVQRGDFGMATIAQERAFASASGPDRDSERARVQLLRQLNEQLRTGLITREQAIRKWNEFRLSWLLP